MQRQPTGLGPARRKLWRGVAGSYQLRADELRVLEDACRLADVISQLEEAMATQPLVVQGSRDQPVVNPLLAEQRLQRVALASALKQLRLPDAGGIAVNQQRAAAQTRWERAHGGSV
jgi:hypothetical protein